MCCLLTGVSARPGENKQRRLLQLTMLLKCLGSMVAFLQILGTVFGPLLAVGVCALWAQLPAPPPPPRAAVR
eukprot:SAG22_NODE_5451_length_1012_cov_0.792990_3_plen_71_part_01